MSSKTTQAKRLRKFTYQESIKHRETVAKVFESFADKIRSDNSDKFAELDDLKINYDEFSDTMLSALKKMFEKSSYSSAKFINDLFGFDLEEDEIKAVANETLKEYNRKYAANKVKSITNTTKNTINNIIEKGQSEGRNIKDIAKEIVDRVDDMSKGRAMTIARTETSSSVNQTSNKAAEKAGMKSKTWMHTDAGKTSRKNHKALDGKKIKLNEKFDLGGIKARFPHDPGLPVGEIVNCYCLCTYS